MKILNFYKYQGTGNDFVMIDNRSGDISLSQEQIQFLCHRKFGVGSDGLLLIEKSEEANFHANFYNPDGSQSFCGNGSRCAVAFAKALGLASDNCTFTAYDGLHYAKIIGETIKIKMKVKTNLTENEFGFYMHTGSPHVVAFVSDIDKHDVYAEGRAIRYSDTYKAEGTNVNFVERVQDHTFKVRTYERGVENETMSCGTGVTAAALVCMNHFNLDSGIVEIKTPGGNLSVEAERSGAHFENIWLCGPAISVYSGTIEIV